MMKNLLLQLDTDPAASTFDAIVAYDGGADHVIQLAGVTAQTCRAPVEGAMFTRAPSAKRHTALFLGGSDLAAGEAVLRAVRSQFFSGFRVSVMLDSNGSNTTAGAAVALLARATALGGREVVVLGGTGPVGSRAAALLARQGAHVRLASRELARSTATCDAIEARFGVRPRPVATGDRHAAAAALESTEILLSAGRAGVTLVAGPDWQRLPRLELIADLSTTPPAGIAGVDPMDRDTEREGKRSFGGITVGAIKLRVHRACIARLFERNDQVLDAEEILTVAREIVG